MNATGEFQVVSFVPANLEPPPAAEITTALPVGVALMLKTYQGQISGRSTTIFTSAFDEAAGGTYVALESFEGSLHGAAGTFNFVHSGSTSGPDRTDEYFHIVAASGTGALASIAGTGGLSIDADGTHRMWFEYELS